MRVLSSKSFDVGPWDTCESIGRAVTKWLFEQPSIEGKQIRIALKGCGKHPQKKSALRQLEDLVVDSVVTDHETGCVWIRFGYYFRFMSHRYAWNDKEIHVTAHEGLFLYRWLVLHDDTCKTQTRYLRNMRKRLGNDFLMEMEETRC